MTSASPRHRKDPELRYPSTMCKYSWAAMALISMLPCAPAPAQAAGKARVKVRVLPAGKALKVTWRLSPYSCHLMELSARVPLEPMKPKKPGTKALSMKVMGSQHIRAPLSVRMVDGKVLRTLSSEIGKLVRRLCSGSNGIKIRLSLTSTARARLTARLTPAGMKLPPPRQDPGRDAWRVASGLYQADFPGGKPRTLMEVSGRILGTGLPPLAERLNLARGQCYQLQVLAAAAGELKLKVLDADDKALVEQTLKAEEEGLLASRNVCPKRTEAYRLTLSTAGDPRAVAWRLVARPSQGPWAGPLGTTEIPEMAPCLAADTARSPRYVCPAKLKGASLTR